MKLSFKKEQIPKSEITELTEILFSVKNEIDETYKLFDITDNDFLIDSYIHQLNSLYSRYNYLLNEIKKLTPTPY